MALVMLLAKFSPEGTKAVVSEGGMVERRAVAERYVAAVGGKVVGYFACADGEWDLVNISDLPETADQGARTLAVLSASGAYSKLRLIRLCTPEEYDGADMSGMAAFRTPGQT